MAGLKAALDSIPEQTALTVQDWRKLECLKENLEDRYDGAPDSPSRWMAWPLQLLSEVLSRYPSTVPEPDSALGAMVDEARIPQPAPHQDDAAVEVYVRSTTNTDEIWEVYAGDAHLFTASEEIDAKRYAAGLRQELEETK